MKRLVSLITATVMVMSTLAVNVKAVDYGEELTNKPTKTYTQRFSDVPSSHWAFSYIGEMAERGVIDGYMDNTFKPENNVTRAEFAKIMVGASGIRMLEPTSKMFSDVELDSWYAPYVQAAYPYLNGYAINGNQYYTPNVAAVREDIAVALVKLKGYDTDGVDESVLTSMFTDVSSISSKARKYIAVAVTRGLVSGYDDNTFRGQVSITRAEATAMLWRAFQYGNDNKTFDTTQNTQASVTEAPTATEAPTPKSTFTPVPTAKATSNPSSANSNTGTVKRLPEPTPSPTPTPRPYVVDTVAKASISNTITMMTTDCDNIYYYDNNKNGIYKLDMATDDVSEVVNLSDVTVGDNSSANQYRDFEIDKLYYDGIAGKLVMKGSFKKVIHNGTNNSDDDDDRDDRDSSDDTDSDDNETTEATENTEEDVDYPMFIDPFTLEELDSRELQPSELRNSEDDRYSAYADKNSHGDLIQGALIINGWGKFTIDRTLRKDTENREITGWNSMLKYDYQYKEWESCGGGNDYAGKLGGRYFCFFNGTSYMWKPDIRYADHWFSMYKFRDSNHEEIRIDDLYFRDYELEIKDNKPMPHFDAYEMRSGGLKQFFLKDETKMYFYDEDTSSIRMLKKR